MKSYFWVKMELNEQFQIQYLSVESVIVIFPLLELTIKQYSYQSDNIIHVNNYHFETECHAARILHNSSIT